MPYTIISLDQRRQQHLDDEVFKTLLKIALSSKWKPAPGRVVAGGLRLEKPFSRDEARELAAALEEGLQRRVAWLAPPVVMALLETIGVLRYDGVRFVEHGG
jgi:hypothetical protein